MKKYLFITLTLLIHFTARADFKCFGSGLTTSLIIQNKTEPGQMLMTLSTDSGQTVFNGTSNEVDGTLFTKQVIQLEANKGTVTVVAQPHFCGRAGCGGDSLYDWKASLKLNDQPEVLFSCYEAAHP
jgi:hypothetical protein